MLTFKEFIKEDFGLLGSITNKLVDIGDNKDIKKIEKMKGVKEMQKYFLSLDRYKKKDLQRTMLRKFNNLPSGDLKRFAKWVTEQRIK